MHTTTIEQRVRHAIVAHHARWHGRAPSTAEIVVAVGAPRVDVERALSKLQGEGVALSQPDGWHTRSPRIVSRAGEAMAGRSQLQH